MPKPTIRSLPVTAELVHQTPSTGVVMTSSDTQVEAKNGPQPTEAQKAALEGTLTGHTPVTMCRRIDARRRALVLVFVSLCVAVPIVVSSTWGGDSTSGSIASGAGSPSDSESNSRSGGTVSDSQRFRDSIEYMAAMKNKTVDALSLNGHPLSWYHIDDVVMGGHSNSSVSVTTNGELRFAGVISTRDGGFSSCSTLAAPLGLPATTNGLNVTVSGNGELFKLTLRTAASPYTPVWQADLPPPSLEPGAHTFALPLAAFVASRMGQPVEGRTLDPTAILSVGLSLALTDSHHRPNPHFRDGPFELLLHTISAISNAPAYSLPPSPPLLPPVATGGSGSASGIVTLVSFGSGAIAHSWSVTNDPCAVPYSNLTQPHSTPTR